MTRFMQDVLKMVKNRRKRVHIKCRKIVEGGSYGYYVPGWFLKNESRVYLR